MTKRDFPDLAKAAKLLKIATELASIPDNSIMSHSIINGVKNKKVRQVIEMVKDQAKDNFDAMEAIVGTALLNEIMDF